MRRIMGAGWCFTGSFVGNVGVGYWSMGFVFLFCASHHCSLDCLEDLSELQSGAFGSPFGLVLVFCIVKNGSSSPQANAGDNIYIFYGTMDKPEELPPKGEFFCKYRDSWMPEVPGT